MQTWLITGGAGFIGSHLVETVLQEREDVRVVNLDALTYAGSLKNLAAVEDGVRYRFVRGDVCDRELVQRLLLEEKVDIVLHLAAESHVDRSIEAPSAFVRTNVEGSANLLECARRAWQRQDGTFPEEKRFLQVSTDEVYGALPLEGGTPFREDTPLAPRSPYAASKAAADLLALSYYTTYAFPVLVTRCSNNYGPRQHEEKLLPKTIACCLRRQPIPLYGDGRNIRDWIHVRDHCAALRAVAERGTCGQVYNIGADMELENRLLVRRVVTYLHLRYSRAIDERLITVAPDRKGHDRRYAMDSSKLRQELGWAPKIPFDRGLQSTVNWYLAAWRGR